MKIGEKNSNSINMKARIRAIFEKYISAEHRVLQALPDPLGINIDRSRQTYFEDPQHPDYVGFQLMDIDHAKDLGDRLRDIWKNEPILLEMIPDLEVVAEAMRKEEKDQAAELDSFIYVMY
jgi:hypothetical protein